MRATLGFALALALAGCDLFGPPWERETLLSEGADRVVVERRLVMPFLEWETQYRIFFSHDGGHHSTRVTEGQTEGVRGHTRARRLPDGRLGVAVFNNVCVETALGAAVACVEFDANAPGRAEILPMLSELAHDRTLDPRARADAASSLARARSPEAAALLGALLDECKEGSDEAIVLHVARAWLTHDARDLEALRAAVLADRGGFLSERVARGCVPELRGDLDAARARFAADPAKGYIVSDLDAAARACQAR